MLTLNWGWGGGGGDWWARKITLTTPCAVQKFKQMQLRTVNLLGHQSFGKSFKAISGLPPNMIEI